MTFDELFVYKKLTAAKGYLGEMEELFKASDKEILKDNFKLHVAERLFQLVHRCYS